MTTTTSTTPAPDISVSDLNNLDIAIIGAGIAGLTLAKNLQEQGYSVAVFEKARGTGGRLSSKRIATNRITTDQQQSYMAFDLGCVSISAQTEEFSQQLKHWQEEGVISPWWQEQGMLGDGRIHYVGTPRNSALTRYLSLGIECHFSTRVQKLVQVNEQGENIWLLSTAEESKLGGVDKNTVIAKAKNVILATPPAQAYDLLPKESVLRKPLESVDVAPQWVMGIEAEGTPLELPELNILDHKILHSISRETLKPQRATSDNNVLQVQATAEWTNNHLDLSQQQVSELLTDALAQYLQSTFAHQLKAINSYSHRWLYSRTVKLIPAAESYQLDGSLLDGFLFDDAGLGLIGDYFQQNTSIAGDELHSSEINNIDIQGVESAWMSAQKLAYFLNKQSLNKKLAKSSGKSQG